MAFVYKAVVTTNLNNLSTAQNSFVGQFNAAIAPTDGAILAIFEDWIELIWDSLRGQIDSGCVRTGGTVDEINNATGEVIRHVGNISPVMDGQATGDSNVHTVAGSMFARTNVPGVRGSKRIAGLTETNTVDGLFNNAILAALTTAATRWIAGPGVLLWRGGVWSSKMSSFVPFANQGGTTNVPGTQTTRKIGRGL